MKLCIVTHRIKKGDGQGRVNYEVVKEAIRRGHNLTLLASEIAPELQQSPEVTWIPIPVEGWPTEFIRNFVFSNKSAHWLRKHRSQVDLVKVNGAITTAASDLNAVHFVHSSWLRSPAYISRNRRDFYGFYQWLYTALNALWASLQGKSGWHLCVGVRKVGKHGISILNKHYTQPALPLTVIPLYSRNRLYNFPSPN